MAYRNGTYVAFHANGTPVPTESDIKYYNLLKAWTAKDDDDFTMINSHEKASAVKDTSKRETLRGSLLQRLRNSKNFALIIGQTTRFDDDWVPFEISKAIELYKLPILAIYTDYTSILSPVDLRFLWPPALASHIDAWSANVLHLPFKKSPIVDAIARHDLNSPPPGPLAYYTREAYIDWGLIAR